MIAVFAGATLIPLTASGQEVATASNAPAETPNSGVANGLMIQARLQIQANPLAMGTGSSFLLGYRGPS